MGFHLTLSAKNKFNTHWALDLFNLVGCLDLGSSSLKLTLILTPKLLAYLFPSIKRFLTLHGLVWQLFMLNSSIFSVSLFWKRNCYVYIYIYRKRYCRPDHLHLLVKSHSEKEIIFEAKPFIWFSHISMHALHILYIHVPMCSCRFWHRWDHLHSLEKITAGRNPKPIFPEIFTSCFNLSSLFWGSIIRIKLPYLSSHKVVGAEDVGIIASICNLKPPHFLTLKTVISLKIIPTYYPSFLICI